VTGSSHISVVVTNKVLRNHEEIVSVENKCADAVCWMHKNPSKHFPNISGAPGGQRSLSFVALHQVELGHSRSRD